MKRAILPILLALLCLAPIQYTYAVKAYPYPISVIQPDGTSLTIRLYGDEYRKKRTTEDGYQIEQNEKGFYVYLETEASGRLKQSAIVARNADRRSTGDRRFLKSAARIDTGVAISADQTAIQKVKALTAAGNKTQAVKKAFPTTGNSRSLVILVNFSDTAFLVPTPQTAFTNMLNLSGYSENGGTGSARDYFMASSYGAFSPQFDVVGPYNIPGTMASYGANDTYGNDINPAAMIVDACAAANADVDFSIYDTDNDGVIDNVFVYYAGYNEAEGAAPNTIWPHRSIVYTSEENAQYYSYNGTVTSVTFDGKRLYDYACTSELRLNSGTSMCGIGTFCHEFGHVLGLPDYYNTANGSSTLDDWTIMDRGNYNNLGRTPPVYSAYDRFFLNWLTPQEISTPSNLAVLPLSQTMVAPASTLKQSYLLSANTHNLVGNNPDPKEFFVMEYRKKTGWDTYLPAEGLLFWHIDYDQTAWDNNTPNNITGNYQTTDSHMRVYLQPLSGSTTTPGTAFTSGSFTPATWAGTNINRAISEITKTNDSISFKLMGGFTPEIFTTGNISGFSTTLGTPTGSKTLNISSVYLTDDVNITLKNTENFDIKLSGETIWAKSITLTPANGVINASLDIRYNPADINYHATQLLVTSSGAATSITNLAGICTTEGNSDSPVIYVGKIDGELNFATTAVGAERSKTLNIKTTDIISDLTLTISGPDAGMFTSSAAGISMSAANDAAGTIITLTYKPLATGTHNAILTISGGGIEPVKVVTLTGKAQ